MKHLANYFISATAAMALCLALTAICTNLASRLQTPVAVPRSPYPAILIRFPGILHPEIESADSIAIADAEQVIGLSIQGHYRAYRTSVMNWPTSHVVHDLIDGTTVIVTFCDRTRCARVFEPPDDSELIDVAVGGFRGGTMLLDIEGRLFPQDSKDVPLRDVDFAKTTWKEWKSIHPKTDVFARFPANPDLQRSNPRDARERPSHAS